MQFSCWPGANLRLLPLLLLWALKKLFSVFPKTKLVSFTCDPRWFPGQRLRENLFLTRNAVDRSYRHCHLTFKTGLYELTLLSCLRVRIRQPTCKVSRACVQPHRDLLQNCDLFDSVSVLWKLLT